VLNFSSLAQIKIDNNGNIGLGTASPAYKVDILGQILIDYNGNIGLGTNPQNNYYKLTIQPWVWFYNGSYSGLVVDMSAYYALALYPTVNNHGNLGRSDKAFREVWAYNFCDLNSDLTQKENIRTIESPLQKIKNLRGVRFDFKPNVFVSNSIKDKKYLAEAETKRKNRIGFIAQEMIHVLPEAVHYVDSTGIYGIDYTRVIPVLVEAIKEQQLIIESLQSEIKELKSNSSKLKSAFLSAGTTSSSPAPNSSEHILYQNVPNPFSQSTTIEYYLADGFQRATLNIYDMNGTQLKSITLHQKGYGNVTLNGYELKAGMYMYALIVDGQLIDTKRMVLTE
jgi:hypothetical protein